MKKSIPLIGFYAIVTFVVLFNTVAGLRYSLFSNIAELPVGKIEYSIDSPNGKYTLNIYSVENVLGSAVRGEIEKGDRTKNVFWQTNITDVDASWIDDNNIIINGMPLDVVHGGTYDCRRGNSLFQEGAVDEIFATENGDVQ